MMQNYKQIYKEQPFCLFANCCADESSLIAQSKLLPSQIRAQKSQKKSLKRTQSKPSLLSLQSSMKQIHLQPIQFRQSSPTELIISPKNSPRVSYFPQSPKPKITFAWKSDLERTKKTQPKEEPAPPVSFTDLELQKTVQFSKPTRKLFPEQKLLNSYKASLISIRSEQSKHSPKVEESLIVVDYFNPTKQQLKNFQSLLDRKEEVDQV